MKRRKPILCLDFDGVIHSYGSGWKGAWNIPDPPVDGAIEFIHEALIEGWDVVIHSSRARYPFGIAAMRRWLRMHAGNMWDTMGPSICEVRFARWKPPAVVTLDDRAKQFLGTWPDAKVLRSFKPWTHLGVPKMQDVTAGPSRCVWAEDGEDGPWASSCGHYWQFTDGTPTENDMKFCPFCGKPLEQVARDEEST